MSNEKEKIQAGLAEYNASVEKTVARFPERGHLPEQRYILHLTLKVLTTQKKLVSLVCILILVVFSYYVSWSFLDNAYVCRFLHC